MSHPVRDAWIEMTIWNIFVRTVTSHPVRDAWIEIL